MLFLLSCLQAQGSAPADHPSPSLGSMKYIPPGSFTMGSPTSEEGRNPNEVQHKVSLSKGFYLMEHEVTQEQWEAMMGTTPSGFKACEGNCPVEQVNWADIQEFIAKVSAKDGVSYRLPTEAEWEYAARGGQSYRYAGSNTIEDVGWYSDNSDSQTHPVCQKQRNGYGLCDMSGNVWEWVEDGYADYPSTDSTDPKSTADGSIRVLCGGSYTYGASALRVAQRSRSKATDRVNDLGFRLAY